MSRRSSRRPAGNSGRRGGGRAGRGSGDRVARRFTARGWPVIGAAVIIAAGLVWYWIGGRERDVRRNVVLIVIDTCRTDHLSCYGYGRPTTPHLDSLATVGVRCEDAYAQAPWTLPSFASLLTSQYPSEHRAGGRLGDFRRFDIATRVLPEELLEHGYATAGIANVTWLQPQFRFSKGFQLYDWQKTDATNTGHRTAELTTAAALAAIDRMPRPFFVMAHYFDPHVRYEPPAPFDTLFTSDYRGPYGKSFGDTDDVVAIRKGELVLDAAARRHLVDLYDGELTFTDAQIGALLDGLRRRGLALNTIVVVTADHGEEFWEHGGFEHGHSLYEDQIRVPLILAAPDLLPVSGTVATPVQQIDIAPTILELVGIAPPLGFRGRSLVAALRGQDTGLPGIAFAEATLWGDELESLRSGDHKLILDTATGQVELYDVEHDPGETRDLATAEPGRVAELEAMLAAERRFAAPGKESEPVPLDETMRRQLEALGYTR